MDEARNYVKAAMPALDELKGNMHHVIYNSSVSLMS